MHVSAAPFPRLRRQARRLGSDRSGNAVIEFAFAMPVMLMLGMYGIELAYMATVNMEVSQIAMSVADNASRLGQTDNSAVTPTVTNADIDSVIDGALEQGKSIKLEQNGRIILSSLERSGTRQYIHWQRCRGQLARASAYGPAGTGLTGAVLEGLGRPTQRVTAGLNSAVMFAEVYYRYDGLFGDMFVKSNTFRQEAALIIRDDRNLNPTGTPGGITGPAGKSACS